MIPAALCGWVCFYRRARLVAFCGMCLASGALGYVGAELRSVEGSALEAAAARTRSCDFVGRVVEQAGGLGTLVSLQSATCPTGALPRGNVIWDVPDAPPTGTVISGRGWITRLGDDEFARSRRAAGGRALLLADDPNRVQPSGVWALVARVRADFRAVARERLDDRRAALLLGVTIGDTEGFTESDLTAFRASGLAHVLAVSGSNVALVIGVMAAFTRRVAAARRLASMLLAVAAFVMLVGPDGSVLRAGAMGAIGLVVGGWVRPVDPRYSLPFALLVLIGLRPHLVASAGLHLSAAATLGIVLWSRPIALRLQRLPTPLANALAVTLSAQLAVAPLIVFLFGRLSLVAPLANVLAAPGVALATILGLAAAALAPVFPPAARALATLAGPSLGWVLEVADRSAGLGWAELALPPVWGWLLAGVVVVAAIRTLRSHP